MNRTIEDESHMIDIQHYKYAVERLSSSQRDLLIRLYYMYPVRDNNELAEKLKYKSVGAVNLQLGKVSNEIIHILNFKDPRLPLRQGIVSNGVFSTIHRELSENFKVIRWEMEPNLARALEEMKLVKQK